MTATETHRAVPSLSNLKLANNEMDVTMSAMARSPEKVELVIPRSLFRSNFAAFLDTYPLRSFALVVAMYVGAAQLDNHWVWLAVLLVGPALVLCEVWNTQDYVTSTRVVRRRGIFGRSRREILLREVRTVRVRQPGFPELPGQRDLEIHGDADVLEFFGVRNAEAIAGRIAALAEQARARESVAGASLEDRTAHP